MIISQWTAADTNFVKKFDAEAAINDDDNFDEDGRELVNFPDQLDELPPLDEYAVTLDAEMVAELNAERARVAFEETRDHARFGGDCVNLSGDPIARGLTSDEEDAEVGRLWGIDASRTEGGE